VNNVGLRNNYVCSVYAAKMMVKRQSGLMVNIVSIGGLSYLFNIPYGFGKEALIRMSADMAIELQDKGVHSIALMCGGTFTFFQI
jgi:dehydrogenase/reductase SDR family protein 1